VSELSPPDDSAESAPVAVPSLPTGQPRELNRIERTAAALIGLGGAGAGGFGIFLSENQAGTAVILVLGVVFLLMAVQGTMVRRITKDGGDFADRAAEQRTVDSLKITLDDRGPTAARAAIEAATAARPQLEQSAGIAAMTGQVYEASALDAIRAAWRNTVNLGDQDPSPWTTMRTETPEGVDAIFGVDGRDSPQIAVEILYTRNGAISRDRLAKNMAKLDNLGVPYLIVSSNRRTAQTELFWKHAPRAIPRQFVEWQPGDPTSVIESAIERLVEQSRGEFPLDADG